MDAKIQSTEKPPTVVDRYFKKHYRTDIQKRVGEDQMVLVHSNRVCVVCLADSHPIIAEGKTVTDVNFTVNGTNRLDNKMSGKSKRGAQWLGATEPLCTVTCSDGVLYTLYCCVKGQLIEANEHLITHPHLLTQKPCGTGYVAIMLPGLKWMDKEIAQLKSEEQYRNILAKRLEPEKTA